MNLSGRCASLAVRSLAVVNGQAARRFADWYGKKLLLYPNHLGPITWERVVRTPHGLRMRARFQEVIGRTLILHERHEPEVTERIEKTLRPGGVFVDVGANIGYYTLLASQLVGPEGLVLAFEPSPNNVAILADNLARNQCRNVVLFAEALSDGEGIARLSLPLQFNFGVPSLGKGPSADADPFAGGYTLTARRRLDAVLAALDLKRPLDLVKIDAEGHEPEVLSGMVQCLRDSAGVHLALELSPRTYSVERLRDQLAGLGFVGEFFENGGWRRLTRECVPQGLCNAWFWRP